MPAGALSVFVSSTCYDLLDLRAELAAFLRGQGFIVRLSDAPDSDFKVDPHDNSIGSCLTNVASSDVVVCVIDQRYGGVLKSGEYEGKSATHAEIDHARRIGKPVFFFVREKASQDYDHLKDDPKTATKWVERTNEDRRTKWLAFMNEVSKLPVHRNMSNWCDLFKNSADLRLLVLKRLIDEFPAHAGTLAMHPDHIVRVFFRMHSLNLLGLLCDFINGGVGPALKLESGIALASGEHLSLKTIGALPERERWECQYSYPRHSEDQSPFTLFCVYENRYRDRYKIEVSFDVGTNGWKWSPERWYVAVGVGDGFRWVEQ